MSIGIYAHLNYSGIQGPITLSDEILNDIGEKYRILKIGQDITLFITTKQAEEIMNIIDEALHDPSDTYQGKEEQVYKLQRELEKLKEGA